MDQKRGPAVFSGGGGGKPCISEKKACHPQTGLCAEYAEFDGSPYSADYETWGGRHDWYYSDAYRTIANIAMDYAWFAADDWEVEEVDRLQRFFCETLDENNRAYVYELDGTVLSKPALHPVAIIATNAHASLASVSENAKAVCVCFGIPHSGREIEDIMITVFTFSHFLH